MTQMNRPQHITEILAKISSAANSENHVVLETYMADLEANQHHRPAHIRTILQMIAPQYPVELGIALETYIANLEAKQLVALSVEAQTPEISAKSLPGWSHQRRIELEKRRRELIARKRNNYQ